MSPTSGVIGEAWGLYKRHWRHLITLSFAVYIAVALIAFVLGVLLELWIAAVIGAVASFIALFWLQAALVKAVDDIRDGTADLSLGETLTAARAHIVPVTLAALLFGLAFGAGVLVFIILTSILHGFGALIGGVGLIAWFLALLVWWSVAVPAIVLESKGVLDGLARSRQLVEGFALAVLGTLVLVILLMIAFAFLLGIVLSPLNDGIQNFVSQLVSGALTAPFLALVLTLLYFRLRAAKEPEPVAEPAPTA